MAGSFKYTFTKREKLLVGILVVIIVFMAWYFFIFQFCNSQVTEYNSKAATAQTQLTTDTAKVTKMNEMQKVIDQNKAAGVTPAIIPKYDNLSNVMAQLDTVLSGTNYTLTFDAVNTSASPVTRGIKISFGATGYDQAREIVTNLKNGPYSCSVDSFAYTSTGGKTSTAAGGTATIHVIYYESK